jgi:hypothetical protein
MAAKTYLTQVVTINLDDGFEAASSAGRAAALDPVQT